MSSWIKKFLDRLAKANNEAFEGQIPDCCGTPKKYSSTDANQVNKGVNKEKTLG